MPSIQCRMGVKICMRREWININSNVRARHGHKKRWTRYLPRDIQLVITDKVRMVTLESIENQALIRFRDLRIRKPPLIGQVHLSWDRTGVQSRCLRVQLEVNGFRRLNTHNEFISGNILEDTLGDILELNTDLDLGLVDS